MRSSATNKSFKESNKNNKDIVTFNYVNGSIINTNDGEQLSSNIANCTKDIIENVVKKLLSKASQILLRQDIREVEIHVERQDKTNEIFNWALHDISEYKDLASHIMYLMSGKTEEKDTSVKLNASIAEMLKEHTKVLTNSFEEHCKNCDITDKAAKRKEAERVIHLLGKDYSPSMDDKMIIELAEYSIKESMYVNINETLSGLGLEKDQALMLCINYIMKVTPQSVIHEYGKGLNALEVAINYLKNTSK